MRNDEALKYAIRGIKGKKTRTWLTLIGIIIGIMTIVSIVSIGDGVKKDINDQLDMFGSDNIIVMPFSMDEGFSAASITASPNSGKLFEKDVERIEKVPGVETVSKVVYGRMSLTFKDNEITSPIYAVNAIMFEQWGDMLEIEKGRYFKDSENYVAVLGNDAANEMFGKDKVSVGNSIYINDQKFKVVGILELIGTSMSQSDDSAIYIPFDTGKDMLGDLLAKDEVSMIYVKIDEDLNVNDIAEQIEYEIAASHKVRLDEKDFSVVTSETLEETIGSVIETLSLFLLLIAAIASIVSGVGIMNTMFMSIMEKTKEIGVLKAIGATEGDITKIFLMESAIIGGMGGVIGIIGGVFVSYIVTFFGILTLITPTLLVGSLLFSLSIGLGAGYIPARRASKMHPIEALRK